MKTEIDYLMAIDESGVQEHDGIRADLNNVAEWLDTPIGTVYGMPSWGNELKQFQHEPTHSTTTHVSIEMSVIRGLARDLPDIIVKGIHCCEHPNTVDKYLVIVQLDGGTLSKAV